MFRHLLIVVAALCVSHAVALRSALAAPVKAAVVRSQGTIFLDMTIWDDLNTGWSNFGDVPVQIDSTSLAGFDLTLAQIQATQADVLILSNPGFLNYTPAEIDAVRQYVESGHGLIISFGKFRSEDRRLAPLVGLSETIVLGTNTWPDPFAFELLVPAHFVFAGLSGAYSTGVHTLASPAWFSPGWQLATGTVLALAMPTFDGFTGNGIIVANEGANHRGLYFPHYIENKSGGSNLQDMQVFYNGLLWTARIPEPTTAVLLGSGLLLVCRRRRQRLISTL